MNKLGSTNAFLAGLGAFIHSQIPSERGATAVEYGLLVAVIAVVVVLGAVLLGGNLRSLFGGVSTDVG
jgi:pilus assembly protein Flp/PilA